MSNSIMSPNNGNSDFSLSPKMTEMASDAFQSYQNLKADSSQGQSSPGISVTIGNSSQYRASNEPRNMEDIEADLAIAIKSEDSAAIGMLLEEAGFAFFGSGGMESATADQIVEFADFLGSVGLLGGGGIGGDSDVASIGSIEAAIIRFGASDISTGEQVIILGRIVQDIENAVLPFAENAGGLLESARAVGAEVTELNLAIVGVAGGADSQEELNALNSNLATIDSLAGHFNIDIDANGVIGMLMEQSLGGELTADTVNSIVRPASSESNIFDNASLDGLRDLMLKRIELIQKEDFVGAAILQAEITRMQMAMSFIMNM